MNRRLKEWCRQLLPRTMRPHRILSGRLKGFWIATSWHDYPAAILGRTERALLEWFEENVRDGETWLDVGAQYGYTAVALSRLVGSHGRVFAFEPMVATAGHLARTRALNGLDQLTVIPCGLGAPETLELRRLPSVRGMVDSTIQPTDGATEVFLLARLDWFWSSIASEDLAIDGIKIDVQGMEIDAIVGMASLLRTFQPKLVVEIHHGVERGRLLDLLESLGYSRTAAPIDGVVGGSEPEYLDDRSYFFIIPRVTTARRSDA